MSHRHTTRHEMTSCSLLLTALALSAGAVAAQGASPPVAPLSPQDNEFPRLSNLQLLHPMVLAEAEGADAGGAGGEGEGGGADEGAGEDAGEAPPGPSDEPFSNIPSDAFILSSGSKRVKKDLSRALQPQGTGVPSSEDGDLSAAIVVVVGHLEQGSDSADDPGDSLEVFSPSDYRDMSAISDESDTLLQKVDSLTDLHNNDVNLKTATQAQAQAPTRPRADSDDWDAVTYYLPNPVLDSVRMDRNRESNLFKKEINDLLANELETLANGPETPFNFVNRGFNTEPAQSDSHKQHPDTHEHYDHNIKHYGSNKADKSLNKINDLFAKALGTLVYKPVPPFVNRGSYTEPAQSELHKEHHDRHQDHYEPHEHYDPNEKHYGSNNEDNGLNKERYDSNKQHYYSSDKAHHDSNKIYYGDHKHYGSNKEHYGHHKHHGSNKKHYGHHKHYDSNKEHYGHHKHYEPNREHYGHHKHYNSNKEHYGHHNHYDSNKVHYGHHEHYEPHIEHYRPHKHYKSNKEHYEPHEHYEPNKEHYGPLKHYESIMGDYGSTKDIYGWNKDESAEREHAHAHAHAHERDVLVAPGGGSDRRHGYYVLGEGQDQSLKQYVLDKKNGQPLIVV